MRLPKFRTLRPGGLLGRVEDNMEEFARALTDERSGLLAHGLTASDNYRGRVFRLKGVVTPDEWAPLTLLNGFGVFGDPKFGAPAVRSNDVGDCETRGAVTRGSIPSGGTPIAAIPAAYAAPANGSRRVVVETLGASGAVALEPPQTGGVIAYAWGAVSFMDLSVVRWRAASGPPAWPDRSQAVVPLGEDYPGVPELVHVTDAKAPDGSHLGPLPVWWRLDRIGNAPAIRILRVGGVRPLLAYDFILSVLSA